MSDVVEGVAEASRRDCRGMAKATEVTKPSFAVAIIKGGYFSLLNRTRGVLKLDLREASRYSRP